MSKGPHARELLELAERGRGASPAAAPAPVRPPVAGYVPPQCPACEGAAVEAGAELWCMHCESVFEPFNEDGGWVKTTRYPIGERRRRYAQ